MTTRNAAFRLAVLVCALAGSSAVFCSVAGQDLPSFLPGYYAPAVKIKGATLTVAHDMKDNHERYVYTTEDQVVSLIVEELKCEAALCKTVFDNALNFLNGQVTNAQGQFRSVTDSDIRVKWRNGLGETDVFAFAFPRSIVFWTYTARLERQLGIDARFDELQGLANRQRYEEAGRLGNVELSRWSRHFQELAATLAKDGRTTDANAVYKTVLAAAPSHYEAHMEFAVFTADRTAAEASARVVWHNAESPELLTKAGKIIGRTAPNVESLPVLAPATPGLRLVLVALPPVDVRLMEEAAKVYETMTRIPVSLARLPTDWEFAEPDRIPDQNRIQQALVQRLGSRVDFTDWTLDRYMSAILETGAQLDALTRFRDAAYASSLARRPAQYDVELYVVLFLNAIAPLRAEDARAMYVGVTANNIYGGSANYVFSSYAGREGRGASVLSYAMMMAKNAGDAYESRKRLVERMAKEMVPASFKALGIPRPTDPSDPYSYADGVGRLDQKTLILSAPVRAALDRLR